MCLGLSLFFFQFVCAGLFYFARLSMCLFVQKSVYLSVILCAHIFMSTLSASPQDALFTYCPSADLASHSPSPSPSASRALPLQVSHLA